ncbi:hypothetical protein [Flagellimonas meridianipacifica]|uniref:Flavodoxin n=1 Tax=Flagellimonas meridianipacifica TaxID=1080225 RepID=A0A2T0MAU3_9FLAO|nr:hypothetical protein [Allomuricauda pacifica]PRX54634.1 hypothetical protein CLV81_3036 [Allomuricauda pacifica]
MKALKKIARTLLFLVVVIFLIGLWYKTRFSMDVAAERTINDPSLSRKLVIATQGSRFKDQVTKTIVDHYASDSVFIRVLDVSKLPEIDMEEYEAMVLMHTWENWKPPIPVKTFMDNLDEKEQKKIVVLTTSGNGKYKMENVDAITGESDLEQVPEFTKEILAQLDPLLL